MSVLQDILITNKLAFKKKHKGREEQPRSTCGRRFLYDCCHGCGTSGWTLWHIRRIDHDAFFKSAVFSNYLFLMNRIVRTGQFTQDDFQHGFKVYFRKVWVVLLIIWVAQFAVMTLAQPFGMLIPAFGLITLIAQVVAFVLF